MPSISLAEWRALGIIAPRAQEDPTLDRSTEDVLHRLGGHVDRGTLKLLELVKSDLEGLVVKRKDGKYAQRTL